MNDAQKYVDDNWVEIWRLLNAGGLVQHQHTLARILDQWAAKRNRELLAEIEKLNANCADQFDRAEKADRKLSLSNLPEQYRGGRFTYDFNEQQNSFEVYTNGFCVATTEDSEVADAICTLFNDAVKYSQTGISAKG